MIPTPTCPSAVELQRLLASPPSDPETAALQTHVQGCATCRQTLGRLTASAAGAPETVWSPRSQDPACLPDPFPGEFRILQALGEGAFGQVWLAEDLHLGRRAALKTLRPHGPADPSARALAALQNEARLLAGLRHPNIVPVYAWRQSGADHYLIEQYVSGGSLAGRLGRGGPLPWQEAARYVADVGEGLVEVHARGIIHRDVKPDNILWDSERDEALLTDFGISARLAEPGTVAGTPLYMAPEAFEGRVLPAMDVYSLAATLFHLVAGESPFRRAPLPALLGQILDGLPDPDPRCQALPAPLEQAIRAGLAAQPEHRPGLRDFVARLRDALNQLLVDNLAARGSATGGPTAVGLRLIVSCQAEGGYRQVAATQPGPEALCRDLKKVPKAPAQVRLHSGDQVRIEVSADRDGYVVVFNVGPTGNLNLLYPDDLSAGSSSPVRAGRPLHVLDVELTPPAGCERLFAVWTRQPLPLRPEDLFNLAQRGPYQASRDMQRVRQSVQALPADDWHIAVLELLDHAG